MFLSQMMFNLCSQEAKNQVCGTRQSAQQVLYQLYATISLTELKGYSMMQFSWMLLKSYGKGSRASDLNTTIVFLARMEPLAEII